MKRLSLEAHSFIRLFIEPLFIVPFPVPDTVLVTGDTAGGKKQIKRCLHGAYVLVRTEYQAKIGIINTLVYRLETKVGTIL